IQAVYGVQLCNPKRNIPEWCDRLPLGLFYDEAPHFYYLFRWLAPEGMELLDASVWDSRVEGRNTPSLINAEYKTKTGFPVYLHVNFKSSITEWHINIVTDKVTVDMDVWRDIFVCLPNDGTHSAMQILKASVLTTWQHWVGVLKGGVKYMLGRHLYGNVEVVTRFGKTIRGEKLLQGIDAEEGRKVVELIHEIAEKARHVE
ncbi:MAG: hypothetical protein GX811_06465, partial [Lentisphaerae bacterium]|nr:hypothetical protein [Lentisphaerota bacterium]